jgi:hypothetical protein
MEQWPARTADRDREKTPGFSMTSQRGRGDAEQTANLSSAEQQKISRSEGPAQPDGSPVPETSRKSPSLGEA